MIVKINRKVSDEENKEQRENNNTCYHYVGGDPALPDGTGRTDKP